MIPTLTSIAPLKINATLIRSELLALNSPPQQPPEACKMCLKFFDQIINSTRYTGRVASDNLRRRRIFRTFGESH